MRSWGLGSGLPYKAVAVRLRTTRTDLHETMVVCSGPRKGEWARPNDSALSQSVL